MGTYSFNEENARIEFQTMIILHEYPLSVVEQVEFERITNAMKSLFKVVSRNIIKNDIIITLEICPWPCLPGVSKGKKQKQDRPKLIR